MGEVYLAEHTLLRRPCAVKLIRPDRGGGDTQAVGAPVAPEEFRGNSSERLSELREKAEQLT